MGQVQLTKTCNDKLPMIITEVKTTLAPIADRRMTAPIHEAFKAKDLLPSDYLVEPRCVDAELFVINRQTYRFNLIDPTRLATGWEARQGECGFSAKNFKVNREQKL